MVALRSQLERLRCPAFLLEGAAQPTSATYRRPLLLWLFAVYRSPAARFEDDERWTRHEPADAELMQWLRLAVRRKLFAVGGYWLLALLTGLVALS